MLFGIHVLAMIYTELSLQPLFFSIRRYTPLVFLIPPIPFSIITVHTIQYPRWLLSSISLLNLFFGFPPDFLVSILADSSHLYPCCTCSPVSLMTLLFGILAAPDIQYPCCTCSSVSLLHLFFSIPAAPVLQYPCYTCYSVSLLTLSPVSRLNM